MSGTYYVTVEFHTRKKLGTAQQEKLREKVLAAIDEADRQKKIPYGADAATATVGEEDR